METHGSVFCIQKPRFYRPSREQLLNVTPESDLHLNFLKDDLPFEL
jgi:hypothetical protein